MTVLASILVAAMLPAVPLPRGAETNAIPAAEGALATWEVTGTLPLPYAEARARLLASLVTAKWRLKTALPMHRQGVPAEILVFDQPSTFNLQPSTSLYFTLQSTGPASVGFNYRREFEKGTQP